MHPLIDKEIVDTIRDTGKTSEQLPDRTEILEENHLPYNRKAENVIISGCQIISTLPHVLSSLSRIFDSKGLSYTYLSKEYCCGNYLYRPAIKARDDQAIAECRKLSKEFVSNNIQQAKKLGAKRLVIFCSPCYPIYKHAFPGDNIVFYPVAINEVMETVDFKGRIDYYAGCYKLHQKFSPMPMDLESTDEVFRKMKNMEVHRIGAPKCCYSPKGLAHMINSVETELMVHICTGCYAQAVRNMKKETEIVMLPELIERAFEK
jgi:Fe-S oxidoreductase